MSFFTSLGILFLAMLIQVFLQLSPGVFAIFYHSALANHTRKKADDLALGFILGQEIFAAIVFLTTYLFAAFSFQDPNFFTANILPWLLVGVFTAEAIFILCFYFRHDKSIKSTRLFITRKSATALTTHAGNVKTRSDAIALGLVTASLELPFTLPLYIILSLIVTSFPTISASLLIILYIIVASLPLFAIKFFFAHHNLAIFVRLRIKYKPLIRLTLTVSYLLVAILIAIRTTL